MRLFVTGTDTDVGKTWLSLCLLRAWRAAGLNTVALKPIAAGVNKNKKNEDAQQLQQAATIKLPYDVVNPLLHPDPVLPFINAPDFPSADQVKEAVKQGLSIDSDHTIIEGAGGWCSAPLADGSCLSAVVCDLKLPVLLVVGMKLGCVNHALLTQTQLEQQGARVIGWVANCCDPQMLAREENIKLLQQRLKMPFLGILEYGQIECEDLVAMIDAAKQVLPNMHIYDSVVNIHEKRAKIDD